MLLFFITINTQKTFSSTLSRKSADQQIFDWASRDKKRKLESSKFAISFNLYVQVLGGPGKLRTIQLENVI